MIESLQASIITCPRSNRLLNNAFFTRSLLRNKKIPLALGTDGKSSNNNVNLLDELRTSLYAYPQEDILALAKSLLLVEDKKIRDFLKKKLFNAQVPKIEIERSNGGVTIFLHCARPGMVIGKEGKDIEATRLEVEKMIGKTTKLNIVEVRSPRSEEQHV